MRVLVALFRFCWDLVVVLTPLFGVWLASSLAAYLDGPRWAALAAGAFLFPFGPLLWELWAERRKRKKDPEGKKKRFLKRADRLVLRTLFLNLGFSGALLSIYPAVGFAALSTRGDWFLPDEARDPWTAQPRAALFWTAGQLEFLYTWARPNEYKRDNGSEEPPPSPNQRGDLKEQPKQPDGEACAPGNASCVPRWPFEEKVHPLVSSMPPAAKQSLETVAAHLKQEPNPYFRVKAIHDFAATHVRYDTELLRAYERGDHSVRRPQDAVSVLKTGVGVCEGYARLAVALGKLTGDKIVYVTGHTRTPSGDLAGVGHAWNAAEINGSWFLIDPTWDAGADIDGVWKSRYEADYLFTPAEVFGLSHFPENPSWQLLEEPITRGEFLRQPILRPAFYAAGLKLVQPTRSQVDAHGSVVIEVENPNGYAFLVNVAPEKGGDAARCAESGKGPFRYTCTLPARGRYTAQLFVGPPGATQLWLEGTLSVVSR